MYISEFTTDIHHIRGQENLVADALSRGVVAFTPAAAPIDYAAIARAQVDDELHRLLQGPTALQFERHHVPGVVKKLWCDMSCGPPRPVIPPQFRHQIFQHFHNQAHQGIKWFQQLIGKRALWPRMRQNIQKWVSICLTCHSSKIHCHTIPTPTHRFYTARVDIVGHLPASHGNRYILTCIDRITRWVEAIPMVNCVTHLHCLDRNHRTTKSGAKWAPPL